MSNYWNNQQALPAPELISTMTGDSVQIGGANAMLLHTPQKLILDNQSTVTIVLSTSIDGGTTKTQFHTFPAGEAIILDQDLGAFPKGTSFWGVGASGDFSVSYTYMKE